MACAVEFPTSWSLLVVSCIPCISYKLVVTFRGLIRPKSDQRAQILPGQWYALLSWGTWCLGLYIFVIVVTNHVIHDSHKNGDVPVFPSFFANLNASVTRKSICFFYHPLSPEGNARKFWEALGLEPVAFSLRPGSDLLSYLWVSLRDGHPQKDMPCFSHSVAMKYWKQV